MTNDNSYIESLYNRPLLTVEEEYYLSYCIQEGRKSLVYKILGKKRPLKCLISMLTDIETGDKKASYIIFGEEEEKSKRNKDKTLFFIKELKRLSNRKYKNQEKKNGLIYDKLSKISLPLSYLMDIAKQCKIGQIELSNIELAKKKLIEGNLRLVLSVVKKIHGNASIFEDLIQEGNMGLMRAVEDYDYNKTCRFSTYAYYWIKFYLSKYIANNSRLIRIPVHANNILNDVNKIAIKFRADNGREPTQEELLNLLDVDFSTEQLSSLTTISQEPVSLDEVIESNNTNGTEIRRIDTIIPETEGTAEDFRVRVEFRDIIEKALAILTPREQKVIRLYYGLFLESDIDLIGNYEKIGKKMNRSRERVRQLHNKAVKKITTKFKCCLFANPWRKK